jgi:hypothetical protein
MSLFLPPGSLLAAEAERYPFTDCQRQSLPAPQPASALLTAFTASQPAWAQTLMRWRDRLCAPLGLKTSTTVPMPSPPYRMGQQLGIFRILALSEQEALLGENDRHLDFRVSLRSHAGELLVTTLVRPHNAFGWVYLLLVLPAHYLIANASCKRLAMQLAEGTER